MRTRYFLCKIIFLIILLMVSGIYYVNAEENCCLNDNIIIDNYGNILIYPSYIYRTPLSVTQIGYHNISIHKGIFSSDLNTLIQQGYRNTAVQIIRNDFMSTVIRQQGSNNQAVIIQKRDDN